MSAQGLDRGLREELERANFQHREEIQEIRSAAREEQRQLHEMISALRVQLEKKDGR